MLLLSILLGASVQAPSAEPPRPAPRAQATATVRILRPASLRVGQSHTLEGKPLRSTMVRSAEGNLVPAKLAEFE